MGKIKIDDSVTRESLVQMFEMNGIPQLEDILAEKPSWVTVVISEVDGCVTCQASYNHGTWRWRAVPAYNWSGWVEVDSEGRPVQGVIFG